MYSEPIIGGTDRVTTGRAPRERTVVTGLLIYRKDGLMVLVDDWIGLDGGRCKGDLLHVV